MDSVSNIFKRLDIQQIRGFLQFGEIEKTSSADYEHRVRMAKIKLNNILSKKFPDIREYSKIESEINHCISICEDAYMEIGIKCGASLLMNLMKM